MSLSAASNHLRGHVLHSATKGVRPRLPVFLVQGKFLTEAEIGQDDVTGRVDEDVLQFDVPVDDPQLKQ